MPDIKFLCIDDQQDQSIEVLLDSLNRGGSLSFVRETPIELGLQIRQILAAAEANKGNGFGLLLDLRLDMEADAKGNKVPYRGPTLAQELRTRMAEKEVYSFPIVLWSINQKFVGSFYGDDTSHDLFDAVYGKDELVLKNPALVAQQMISLAEGYRELKLVNGLRRLGLPEDDSAGVHATFIDEYLIAAKRPSRHDVANLLLEGLIKMPGLLVEEAIVAARLGVDIDRSEKSWAKLRDYFETATYRGPFCDGWPRWWWFRIEDWWNSLSDKQPNLRRIVAEERVRLLNSQFNLKLVAAQPIRSNYSRKFFSLCVAMAQPLDPADGLRVAKSDRKGWHDTPFISVHAALERIKKNEWRIDPLDRERLRQLKAQSED